MLWDYCKQVGYVVIVLQLIMCEHGALLSTCCLHWFFSPATSVLLTDNSFPADQFNVLHGLLSVKWKAVAPYPCGHFTIIIECVFLYGRWGLITVKTSFSISVKRSKSQLSCLLRAVL